MGSSPAEATMKGKLAMWPRNTKIALGLDGQPEPDKKVHADSITTPNGILDEDKFESIARKMKEYGWRGRPVLVEPAGDGYQCLTGSHRTLAAKKADIEVPIVVLDPDKWIAYLRDHDEDDTQTVVDYVQSHGGADDDSIEALMDEIGDAKAAKLMRLENYTD